MLLIFFILSAVLSLIILFAKNNLLTKSLTPIYLISVVTISIYSYLHLNQTDTVYYQFDGLGILLTMVLALLSLPTFYHSYLYLKRNNFTAKQEAVYYASLMLFITAMISSYFAENVALLWVSVESTTLFISILIYFKRTSDALEATWKYLFVSSVGLAIAFIGILFLSIIASDNGLHSLSFNDLASLASSMNITWLKIAFVLMVTGFSVKISVFPLFAVAIDAKTIAASPVNALMSTALVNVGFVGIYRTYIIISKTEILPWAQHILMLIAVVSIFLAAIQLTRVKRLKRMYAFSSMEHMGIVLLGLAVGGIGYYAAILHLVFHSLVKAALFFQIGTIHKFSKSIWIKGMGSFFKQNPTSSLTFILGIISILAIPPSGLFVSELLTFKALFVNGNYLVAITVLIFLTAIIFLFVRNVFHILFNSESIEIDNSIKHNPYESISQFILFGLVVYLGINPPVFFTDLINSAIAILN